MSSDGSVPAMDDGRRVRVIPDISDPRFIWLRLDRAILAGILVLLSVVVMTMVWVSLYNARSDDAYAREIVKLREDIGTTRRIINNANAISHSNIEFLRCAFLIEPDVQKTEEVVDRCIEQADFPEKER